MNFSWSAEQVRLYDECVAFARENLNCRIAERDLEGTFLPEIWAKCAEFVVLGWCMPTEYGGSGRDVVTTIRMLEGIGYGCRDNGLTLGLNGQIWAVQEPIQTFGSPAQRKRYLPGLASGKLIGAHGIGSSCIALQSGVGRFS